MTTRQENRTLDRARDKDPIRKFANLFKVRRISPLGLKVMDSFYLSQRCPSASLRGKQPN